MNESQPIKSQFNSDPVKVRVLTPADAAAYRRVRLQALHEHPPAFGSLPENEPPLAETIARLAESGDRIFLGAFQSNQLVGIVRLCRYSASNERHRAYLRGFMSYPRFGTLAVGERSLSRHCVKPPTCGASEELT